MMRTRHRLLRLVLRLDQAGSAAFIVLAPALVVSVPVLALLAPMRTVLWVVGAAVIAYAVALALLGVFMACGLTRSMARRDELSLRMWRSLLGFPAGPPKDVTRS